MGQRCEWTGTGWVTVIGCHSPHSSTNIVVHLLQSRHFREHLGGSVLVPVRPCLGDAFVWLDTVFCHQNLVRVQLPRPNCGDYFGPHPV